MFYGGKYNENPGEIKTLSLSNFYNQGLVNERIHRLKYRKDIDFYFDSSTKRKPLERRKVKPSTRIPKTTPYHEIVEGVNLFDLPLEETTNLKKIFKLKFTETKEFQLDKLSCLPFLNGLIVQFSNIIYNQEIFSKDYHSQFPCLENLDLSFNGLNSDIFLYVRKIKMLRVLNLMGNNIDSEICDLKEMENLEELILSHNKIESYYLSNSESFTKINTNDFNLQNQNDMREIEENPNQNCKSDQNQKFNHTNEEQFVTRPYVNYNVNYLGENIVKEEDLSCDIKKTKAIYDDIQTYMKTNIQEFLHNLSSIPNLKVLDLSNNQIHFFDINPFHIQKNSGFKSLIKLDISRNIINEELGIILIMNLPSIEMIYFEGNPLLNNKKNFEAIEYELFRNKNILFFDSGSSLNKQVLNTNKLGSIKTSFPNLKPLKINFTDTNKLLRKKYKSDQENSEFNKINEKKVEEALIPEFNRIDDLDNVQNNEANRFQKNNKSTFFLTNEPNMNSKSNNNIDNDDEENTYQNFLKFARKCLGEEKVYNQVVPISQAYSRLRMIYNNSKCESNENLNTSKHYLQGTIIGDIRSQQYIPSKENLKNEFRFLSKFRNLDKSQSLNNSADLLI